jgi:hypothetical protein
MAAGIIIARTSFDSQIGNMATQLDGVLTQWHQLRTYITGPGGGFSGIQAAPLSYTDTPSGSGDASHVFNASADIEQLYQIYIGAQNLGTAKDFRTSGLNQLFGTGTH